VQLRLGQGKDMDEKPQRMKLELMSGLEIRLPPLVLVSIDDIADLITLLGYWDGMDFSLTPNSKMDITLNAHGSLHIDAAIKMHNQGFVRHLLWNSTKVPGDVRWLRRIEINHYQCHEPTMVMSDYQSTQGWTFDPVPPYTIERLKKGD